ncbi:MAG: GNAT family N-acetyltransferase [Fidelibacterota bacterium]|nr:MAG: GNAT family N-acetyltransferase [Candidatus Neomarinimicrobiota bacterium]
MIDQLVRWRAEPEAREHQPITPMNRDQLTRYLDARQPRDLTKLIHNDYILIIEDADNHNGVGWLTIEILSRLHGLARLGYTIGRDYWGQGYATAAVQTVVHQLFTETPIERIEADCSIHNPASRRVLEKCGFRFIGTKRKYLVIQGERVDHHYFELCKDDFHTT